MANPIDLIAKAVARSERRDMRLIWATATDTREVQIDGSDEPVAISASAVGPLLPGQRVLCIRDNLRLTAIAAPPA